jgi:murein DD-endopeptidase MepM/ murein hydrolase activator NlpD
VRVGCEARAVAVSGRDDRGILESTPSILPAITHHAFASRGADRGNDGPIPAANGGKYPVPPPTGGWTSTPVGYPSFYPRHQLLRPLGGASIWHYPIAAGSPVTSEFGWRIHPISGDRRFHAGLDLAAPSGTSVLAVTAAQVQSAGRNGGYGLAIVLQHSTGDTQTLCRRFWCNRGSGCNRVR